MRAARPQDTKLVHSLAGRQVLQPPRPARQHTTEGMCKRCMRCGHPRERRLLIPGGGGVSKVASGYDSDMWKLGQRRPRKKAQNPGDGAVHGQGGHVGQN